MNMLLPNTIVYAASVQPLADPETYRRAYGSVSRMRQQKADGYRFEKDRFLCVGAELLLRYGLREAGIAAGPPEFRTNDCGKPELAGTDLRFNLSHSGEMAICAVSDVCVGCDIEKIRTADLRIAERFFCPEEYAHIAGQQTEEERNVLFYRYWTLKESFLKATGLGFQLPLGDFCMEIEKEVRVRQSVDGRTYFFHEFDEIPGYRCAVCLVGEPRDAELKIVDLTEEISGAAADHAGSARKGL